MIAEGRPSPGARAKQLMREAKAAGEEQVTDLLSTVELMIRQAREIADGGEIYPAGVRDICAKLIEHTGYRAQGVYAIMRPNGGLARMGARCHFDEADLLEENLEIGPFPASAAG
ncbi:MAG TPA: hypothetical protein VL358_14110 [Caulobacteraceae bacterium]|nr:hypothetical protein [Caulobacteraceae bacterium]